MTVYEMAAKYYPRLWSIERLNELARADRITTKERDEIVSNAAEAVNIE